MKRNGLTILELLAVMAIIAVLSAILFPVFSQAKESGHQSACISNLSQVYKSLEVYRSDNNGNPFGSASEMGLPPLPQPEYAMLRCNSRPNGGFFPYKQLWQGYVAGNSQSIWSTFVMQHEGNTPMLVDVNHNPKDIPTFSPYFQRLGIVVYLDGSTKKVRRSGDQDALSTWSK